MTKKIVLFIGCIVFVLQLEAQNETNKWVVGVSAAFAGYTKPNATLVGGQIAFQTPRLTVARYFKRNFIMVASFASAIGDTQDYTTFDGAIRYDFGNGYNTNVPYVLVGGSFIQANRFTPTLNFGVGTTLWFSEQYGINAQIMYKYSESRFESQRSHVYPSVGIVYSFGARGDGNARIWNSAH